MSFAESFALGTGEKKPKTNNYMSDYTKTKFQIIISS